MRVSDEQLFEIQGYLLSEGLTDVSLQEDLADHFCCVIEEEMKEDGDFKRAFEQAKRRITPSGAGEFQQELNYLLTIKKKVMVRKLVFVFGFFGLLDLMLALGFRVSGILDAQTSGLLALAGILTLSVTVLPFWVFQQYKKSVQRLQEG